MSEIITLNNLCWEYVNHVSGDPKYEVYETNENYRNMNIENCILKDSFSGSKFNMWLIDKFSVKPENILEILKTISKRDNMYITIKLDKNITVDKLLCLYAEIIIKSQPVKLSLSIKKGLGKWKQNFKERQHIWDFEGEIVPEEEFKKRILKRDGQHGT
jgi:hypothetical protein